MSALTPGADLVGSQSQGMDVSPYVMKHDFNQQKQETVWVWEDICDRNSNLPAQIDLDIQFLPQSPASNKAHFKGALEEAGFVVECYEQTVEAKVAGVHASADAIWLHEERATKIALSHGFKPDGWGFLSNSD